MHHTLDTKPVLEKVLYINEPDLADSTIDFFLLFEVGRGIPSGPYQGICSA